jgi:hypothetical protein
MAYDSQEKPLESKLVKWVTSIGGKAVKGPAFMYMGIPDRIIVLPNGGGTVWVEVKGGTYYTLTAMQEEWRERMLDSSPDRYFVVDNKEDLDHVIAKCKEFMGVNA